jgi:hypothetical protein
VSVGRLELKDGTLELETRSMKRLERGKALVGRVLGNLVRHRSDVVQDPMVAMEEHKQRRPEPDRDRNEIPPEVMAMAVNELMNRQMKHWLDDHIPALGGKTPRQAARTKAGRQQVIDLLHGQENLTHSSPGGKDYDFTWLYRELGLPVPE